MKSVLLPAVLAFLVSGYIGPAIAVDPPAVDDELSRMLYRAAKSDEEIENGGLVYVDAQATQYLNAIMDKLYPDYAKVFNVRIYISTDVNAFVLANGSVYVNIGMLAKAENEAQIAAILAHEGAHYVHNHQLQTQQNLKTIASGAEFFGLERSLSYLSDYSIELELEADNAGFNRLIKARYDPREAVNIFRSMDDEAQLFEKRERSVYNTHPKMLERIEYFTGLSQGHTGFVGKDAYLKITSEIRIKNLELNLSKYRYKNVLLTLEDENRRNNTPLQAWFYLGEAYRQRGDPGDEQKALAAYMRAIQKLPQFAPTYAAMGVFYMKQNEFVSARRYFRKYLELSPNGPVSGYIRQYYRKINDGAPAQ